jgi:hypothetical protein
MAGINDVLMRLAAASLTRDKQAFVPQPDMAAAGGDPAAMGQDPMAMAAQGADPAAIMAAQGQPVDPMMAMAGGASGMPPAGAAPAGGAPSPVMPIDPAIQSAIDQAVQAATGGAGGAGGKGAPGAPSKKDKLDEIHTMLTKVVGVLVGRGLLSPQELGGVVGQASMDQAEQAKQQAQQGGAPEGGMPAEQKMAADGAISYGAPVELKPKQVEAVQNSLAGLILALRG